MSLLSILPLRFSRFSRLKVKIPGWLQSLRGVFTLFLLVFCLLQCASAIFLSRLVNDAQYNVAVSHQLAGRQSLLDKARMELLTASDNSQGAGIYLMQDRQTGSVDSWRSLAETARNSLDNAKKLFSQYAVKEDDPLKASFGMLADGLSEQLDGLSSQDIDAFFRVPMQAFQQQFNADYYHAIAQFNTESARVNQSTLSALTGSRTASLWISALLLALLIAGGIVLLRGVILPLNRASGHLSRVAVGDISQQLNVRGWQMVEMRQLTDSITEMQEGLQHIASEINAVSQAVMLSADQMAVQSEEFSAQNSQQSAAFAHISQRLNQVAEEVEHSVAFTHHATQRIKEADSLSQRCGAMVTDVDRQMRQIVGASGEIAGIVSLLESLSVQTKLLALNAAIESAHAGAYGRSFAVVAREIGLLSEKSGASTSNIDRLITTTHHHIDSGFTKVQALESLYAEITQAVTGVVTLLNELHQNASAQSRRVTKVAEEITRLNDRVSESEALTARSASAAERLVSHAQRLSESTRQFVL
ncbi:methyl-accepting chemotaxis protein [Erwinia sp. P6884]|uniref:methyl-accepting chemotaxis protein n=1 Tax=Erwinia sp. P6884 TaxID=3141450 RepID=UPI00318AEBEB